MHCRTANPRTFYFVRSHLLLPSLALAEGVNTELRKLAGVEVQAFDWFYRSEEEYHASRPANSRSSCEGAVTLSGYSVYACPQLLRVVSYAGKSVSTYFVLLVVSSFGVHLIMVNQVCHRAGGTSMCNFLLSSCSARGEIRVCSLEIALIHAKPITKETTSWSWKTVHAWPQSSNLQRKALRIGIALYSAVYA